MFRNQLLPTAGTKWTIEQRTESTILIGWTKSNTTLNEEGEEKGFTLYKTGFVDPDHDFLMEGKHWNLLLIAALYPKLFVHFDFIGSSKDIFERNRNYG